MATRRPFLDRLAMRAAGVIPREPLPAADVADDGEPTMTRADAVKAAGAAAALTLLPLHWADVAEAKKDCFEPCLGIVEAAGNRELRRCAPRSLDFYTGASLPASIWCTMNVNDGFYKLRLQCFKPACGSLEETIRKGGHINNFPVAPLEPPPGTSSGCDNCRSAGGYCGACSQGSTGNPDGKTPFFCGTPGVPPCRYCGGC